MALDVINHIGAVVRAVEDGERDGKPARAVVATAEFGTTVDDLWDAITSAERIPRWFMPVSGELRPGGHYQLDGNAGGTITQCEPPRRLGVTWELGGNISWVDVELAPKGDERATLRLEHSSLVEGGEDFWRQFGPGAVGVGWDLALLGLNLYIERGEGMNPKEAEAWMLSPEGRACIRASSEAWAEASVAFGTDREAADASRDATTAFYTGGEA